MPVCHVHSAPIPSIHTPTTAPERRAHSLLTHVHLTLTNQPFRGLYIQLVSYLSDEGKENLYRPPVEVTASKFK